MIRFQSHLISHFSSGLLGHANRIKEEESEKHFALLLQQPLLLMDTDDALTYCNQYSASLLTW